MGLGDTKIRWPAQAILLSILLLATNVGAHPYDDPLKFEAHTHEGGRVIFTNIPKRCFRNGVLICLDLHPLLDNRPPPEAEDQPSRIERGE